MLIRQYHDELQCAPEDDRGAKWKKLTWRLITSGGCVRAMPLMYSINPCHSRQGKFMRYIPRKRRLCATAPARPQNISRDALTGGRSFMLRVLCVWDWKFIVFYHSIQLRRSNVWNIVSKQMIHTQRESLLHVSCDSHLACFWMRTLSWATITYGADTGKGKEIQNLDETRSSLRDRNFHPTRAFFRLRACYQPASLYMHSRQH
jgi:hypothetical protein